jgi:hypothetical protein
LAWMDGGKSLFHDLSVGHYVIRFTKRQALHPGSQGFNKVHNYVTLRERSSATEESRSLW